MAVYAAIAQLPHVEQRLEAMFWALSERWGRVTPSGIHLPLTLTHEILGHLIGARRPTVSLALIQLAEREVLIRRPDRSWLLIGPRPPAPAPRPAAAPTLVAIAAAAPTETLPAADGEPLEAWLPAMRSELLSAVTQAREQHISEQSRLTANLRLYREARVRSEALRAQSVREREIREQRRAQPERLSPAPRPVP
jgi:hypothetical protein